MLTDDLATHLDGFGIPLPKRAVTREIAPAPGRPPCSRQMRRSAGSDGLYRRGSGAVGPLLPFACL